MNTLATAIADRRAIEVEDNTMNDNKSKTFERIAKSATDFISKVFDEFEIDMSAFASRRRKTAMLNIYAVERTIDLAAFMSGNAQLNHFTHSIVKSLNTLNKNNIDTLTHSAARVACTSLKDEDKKVDKDALKHLTRVSKAIAFSTVNTQCTITLDALRIMKVIEETSSANNEKAYKFADTDAAKRLIENMIKHNKV